MYPETVVLLMLALNVNLVLVWIGISKSLAIPTMEEKAPATTGTTLMELWLLFVTSVWNQGSSGLPPAKQLWGHTGENRAIIGLNPTSGNDGTLADDLPSYDGDRRKSHLQVLL